MFRAVTSRCAALALAAAFGANPVPGAAQQGAADADGWQAIGEALADRGGGERGHFAGRRRGRKPSGGRLAGDRRRAGRVAHGARARRCPARRAPLGGPRRRHPRRCRPRPRPVRSTAPGGSVPTTRSATVRALAPGQLLYIPSDLSAPVPARRRPSPRSASSARTRGGSVAPRGEPAVVIRSDAEPVRRRGTGVRPRRRLPRGDRQRRDRARRGARHRRAPGHRPGPPAAPRSGSGTRTARNRTSTSASARAIPRRACAWSAWCACACAWSSSRPARSAVSASAGPTASAAPTAGIAGDGDRQRSLPSRRRRGTASEGCRTPSRPFSTLLRRRHPDHLAHQPLRLQRRRDHPRRAPC